MCFSNTSMDFTTYAEGIRHSEEYRPLNSRKYPPKRDKQAVIKRDKSNLRRARCQAATVMMHRGRSTWLRTWLHRSSAAAARSAMVALARRASVILHRRWGDDADFLSDDAGVRTVPMKVERTHEICTSGLHLNQHHVGSQLR